MKKLTGKQTKICSQNTIKWPQTFFKKIPAPNSYASAKIVSCYTLSNTSYGLPSISNLQQTVSGT